MEVNLGTKTAKCTSCGFWKAFVDFYPDRSKRLGISSRCRECSKKHSRDRYANNTELIREQNSTWRKNNRHKITDWNWRNKLKVIALYGGECVCCGETEPEFLTIDHIGGWGAEHRRENKSAGSMFQLLAKYDTVQEGFQLLCWNCNCSDGIYKYCPHKTTRKDWEAEQPWFNPEIAEDEEFVELSSFD